MAAYAAVISLKQTIERLLNSSEISIISPSRETLQSAYEKVRSLQAYLERLESSSSERVNALNGQIRDAVCELEDAIVFHTSQFLSQTKIQINVGAAETVSLDFGELKKEFCCFTEMVKRIEEENRIEDLLAEEDNNISVRPDFGGKCSKMVGFSDLFSKIIGALMANWRGYLYFVSIVGMTGIGKTFLAKKVFEDPIFLHHFDHRVFVTIGPKYQLKQVMLDILAQLVPNIDEIRQKKVGKVGVLLHKTLLWRRYLIVLDDVWETSLYNELGMYLPDDRNQSRVLMTTSIQEVAKAPKHRELHKMPFLNKDESWNLLRERVFGEEYYPFQLEKYGKKIAEICEGLPLAIVVVAGILSKNDRTVEYWKETAKKKNSVFADAYDQMFEVLIPSYQYLSQPLKPCFLYTGVFPPSWKITMSKIIKLLSAERFLESHYSENLEHFAREHLKKLISRSLLLVHQHSSKVGPKTWSLHSVYWYMCNKQARMEKFFHLINNYPISISTEDIKGQQRFCIHNNSLFGIKEVHNSMESILTVRSLLCTGPDHQYPVRICFSLRFLRVLDALTVRFYKFPIEVLKLVQLRYLALTFYGNVPASIYKLWNLEYFFVHRHLSIKPFGSWPYLPVEIWNMKELRHLQVVGSNLPYHCGAVLPNLFTLSNVSADSCTREILEGVPNLKKLGIQIELPPDAADAAEPLCLFDHLSVLHRLESLKCIIVNPKPSFRVVAPPTLLPPSLKKLNLSGFGFPWEYMSMIAQLPLLEALKLKRYAFQGPVWEIDEMEFAKLKYLLIEETDLVNWIPNEGCFPRLKRLIFRHCYKLKDIPFHIGDIQFLKMIELVDCPLAMASLKGILEEQKELANELLQARLKCSWEEGELES